MQLYIGNKNYSSWSLRAWLLMTQRGIPFEEIKLRLSWEADSAFKKTLAGITPTGRVPVLVDDGFAVWDTLAIAEYLAERHPEKQLWPADRRQRARARSLCAEMHAGFGALRTHCPMNLEVSMPEVGQRLLAEQPDVAHDLERIGQMWTSQLAEHGGPFLFGEFGIVDAFYAPVCARVRTYGLPLPAPAAAYVERIFALPAMQAWVEAARAEHDFIVEDDPYRSAPAR
jgi:glutathione S-transferase